MARWNKMLGSALRKVGAALSPRLTDCANHYYAWLGTRRSSNRLFSASALVYNHNATPPDGEPPQPYAAPPETHDTSLDDMELMSMLYDAPQLDTRTKNKRLVKQNKNSSVFVMTQVLEKKEGYERWENIVASSRSLLLPIITTQYILRRWAASDKTYGRDTLDKLPSEEELDEQMRRLENLRRRHVISPRDYAYILMAETDNERAELFLQHRGYLPNFIFLFLVRRSSSFDDISSLRTIIAMFKLDYWVPHQSFQRNLLNTAHDYLKLLSSLTKHLLRIEPRLIVELAGAVLVYLPNFHCEGKTGSPYIGRCKFFNELLQIFQPTWYLISKTVPAFHNSYYWESQRMLLDFAVKTEPALTVTDDGYRAIRNTLASLPKDEKEKQSARLQKLSWPPYLAPGNGMNEKTDPQENWSRTVTAGVIMQEEGYEKSEQDESLDVLKGLASDGSPTIQQRLIPGDGRKIGTWEAAISATRNSYEAWNRFNDAPTKRSVPGIDEYAAMFIKLTLGDAPSEVGWLPGDNARNTSPYKAPSMTEIEWAKLQPPSVEELYLQMLNDGIYPHKHCLFVLVSNAPNLATAHRYLLDSAHLTPGAEILLSREIDPEKLQHVDLALVSAYITMLARREDGDGWHHLYRAVKLAETRLGHAKSRWGTIIWGAILRGSSQHHKSLNLSQAEQVRLMISIAERIDRTHGLSSYHLSELNRGLSRLIRYDTPVLIDQLRGNQVMMGITSQLPLRKLYETNFGEKDDASWQADSGQEQRPPIGSLKSLTEYIKRASLKLREVEILFQSQASDKRVAALDRMESRRDIVRSEHALQYMLAMAYAGEFEEMGQLLMHLVEQWSQQDVVEALEALEEMDGCPLWADFSEVLCVFRLFAEDKLGGEEMSKAVRETIERSGVRWMWPTTGQVVQYLENRSDASSMRQVRNMQKQMRMQVDKFRRRRAAKKLRYYPDCVEEDVMRWKRKVDWEHPEPSRSSSGWS